MSYRSIVNVLIELDLIHISLSFRTCFQEINLESRAYSMPCQLGLDTAGSLALRDRNEMTAALAEYRSISVLDKSRL